ncbi:hypothetical protein ACRAQ7_08105 [Erythrobacter sp. W53]|uniref:hypothetical protein n=1 Tax=Erythrobacter sp. W53 TaxID=3425947 RepID=UPI003D7684EE
MAVLVGGYFYFGLPLPSSHSDDPRVAYVFARESLGSAPCIHIRQENPADLLIPIEADENGPPGQLTQDSFDSEEVGLLSEKLASGEFQIVRPKIKGMRLVGLNDDQYYEEACFSSIGSIIVAEDIAIVRFTSPNGPIGAYVFKREFFGWRAIERVWLGFW